MSRIAEIFGRPLSAINVGAAMFAEDIEAQGAAVTHLDWTPPGGGDAAGDHFGIAEDRRAGLKRSAGRSHEIRREDEMPRRLDEAGGVYHAHGDIRFRFGEAREIGLGANDREGFFIDGGAILDVVVLCHCWP